VDLGVPVANWRKSSRCDAGQCVEVARLDDNYALRNSTLPEGTVLTFNSTMWSGFLAAARAGEFDPR
jgi:hypothetical protein